MKIHINSNVSAATVHSAARQASVTVQGLTTHGSRTHAHAPRHVLGYALSTKGQKHN